MIHASVVVWGGHNVPSIVPIFTSALAYPEWGAESVSSGLC